MWEQLMFKQLFQAAYMNKMFNIHKDQSGVLLLLALVMTSVVLTSALIVSTLAIRESRLSLISDKGMTALFGSESITEDTIYRISKLGIDPLTLDNTSSTTKAGVEWTREVKQMGNQFIFDFLPAGRTVDVDLYNTANLNDSADIVAINFAWSSGTELAVVYSEWDGITINPAGTQSFPCASSPCSAVLPVSQTSAYRLQLTAGQTAITDLIISMSPSAVDQIELSTTVRVVGEYQGSRQAVELILPKAPPWDVPPPPPPTDCGNEVIDPGENCDDGDATNAGICNEDCSALTFCGDGTTQTPNGNPGIIEQCDGGAGCDLACQMS